MSGAQRGDIGSLLELVTKFLFGILGVVGTKLTAGACVFATAIFANLDTEAALRTVSTPTCSAR